MGAKSVGNPDPLGKRALYGAPATSAETAIDDAGIDGAEVAGAHVARAPSPTVLPVGKRALYSAARPHRVGEEASANRRAAGRGPFTVRCQRCFRASRVGLLDLLIFQFPVGVWLPRGKFDRRMTCPSCRKRSWCSVTLRGD